jgi:hypothetical protein
MNQTLASMHPAQEFRRQRERERRTRDRFNRQHNSFPWGEAAAAVLRDEAVDDEATAAALVKELARQGEHVHAPRQPDPPQGTLQHVPRH